MHSSINKRYALELAEENKIAEIAISAILFSSANSSAYRLLIDECMFSLQQLAVNFEYSNFQHFSAVFKRLFM